MTVRSPLSEVLGTTITGPSDATTKFIVGDGSVEAGLSVAAARALLGTKGYSGSQGIRGYTGSIGEQGYIGSTGTQGIQGIDGFTGSIGIGFIGSRGDKGDRGYSGSTGTQGRAGYTGSVGFTGSRGYIGSTGTIGFTGSRGIDGIQYTTATNMAGGVAGNILIQNGSSSTAFISTGSVGNLLQYQTNNTATWVSTSTLLINKSVNSDFERVVTLTNSEITPLRYPTMVSGGGGSYFTAGVTSDLTYHTNNKILTSPGVAVSGTTSATSTLTGALIVAGGIGVGGDLWIGGTITAEKLVIQYTTVTSVSITTDDITKINNTTNATSTLTGALQVQGGVGIGRNVWVGGDINFAGNLYQNGVLFTGGGGGGGSGSLTGGTLGQIPWQSAPSVTSFFGPGTAGQLLMSSGASVIGPAWRNTSSLLVGYASNLAGGGIGSIPYQSSSNVTAMLSLGLANQILTVNASANGVTWASLASLNAGNATTATNLAGGSAGRIAYQVSTGRTGFTNSGTVGQILTSGGLGSPVWVNSSAVAVGYTGSRGYVGSIGYTGSSGAAVDRGYAGSIGGVGFTGSRGAYDAIGFTGSKGDLGFTGSVGFTGSRGATGYTGSVGFTGSVGYTGSRGITGYTGSASTEVGFTGSVGAGYTGSIGPLGYSGSRGSDGAPASSFAYGGVGEIGRYLDFHSVSGSTIDFDVRMDSGGGVATTGEGTLTITATGGVYLSSLHTSGDVYVGNGGSSLIRMADSDEGERQIHCNSNRIGFLNQAGSWGSYCNDDGSWTSDYDITAYSDIKLKDNIITIDSALDKTLKLRGVYYTRKDKEDKIRKVGVIAQEIQEILPEVVRSNFDNADNSTTLSVDYGNITALLIEAIKELNAKVEALEKRLA